MEETMASNVHSELTQQTTNNGKILLRYREAITYFLPLAKCPVYIKYITKIVIFCEMFTLKRTTSSLL